MSRLRGQEALHRQTRRPEVLTNCMRALTGLPRRIRLRVLATPTEPLVQVYVSADPIQERRLQSRTWTAAWRHADNRLDPQAQTRPSHDGAQRGQAIKRRRANGRRLYRRQPPGTCGRGAAGKTPFVAAVSTTSDGKPDQIVLRRVARFSKTAIARFAGATLDAGVHAVSDGFRCFAGVTEAGCTHSPVKTGSGAKAAKNPRFKWVNTILGNIKEARFEP